MGILPDIAKQLEYVIEAAKEPSRSASGKAFLGPVSEWVCSVVNAELGINISSYQHTLNGSTIRHIFKKHSNPETEKKRGQTAVTEADIKGIPCVVSVPDEIILGNKSKNHNQEIIIYSRKTVSGTIFYVQELHIGRRELAAITLWKRGPATDSALAIARSPFPNVRNGSGDEIRVVKGPIHVKTDQEL